MENFNFKLDRPKITTEEIQSRQNFGKVLEQYQTTTTPVYKNPWFWGSAGLATVGLTTVISLSAFSKQAPEDKTQQLISKNLPPDTECIKAPIPGEDHPFKTYLVDPAKDESITLESGTLIEIDKGSLKPEKPGSAVEIQVREFPDKATAFIAGIPMDYENNTAFESAGMIEIRGTQDGKAVKINPEIPVKISLATIQDPEGFDFWALDDRSGAWTPYPAEINEAKRPGEVQKKQGKTAQQTLIPQLKKTIAGQQQELARIEQKIQALEKPSQETYHLPKAGKQRFDLAFDKQEYPELAKFENLVFEVVPSSGYDPAFTKKNWSDVELLREKENYIMHFKSAQEQFKIQVRPILEGKELKQAQHEFDEAISSYKKSKAELESKQANSAKELEENEARLKQLIAQVPERNEAQLLAQNENAALSKQRMEAEQVNGFAATIDFKTNRWGVFNSDKPIAYPKPFAMGIAMIWIGDQLARFKQVFVFNQSKNTRYTYGNYNQSVDNFGFHLHDELVIIGIDNEGNVGYAQISKAENKRELEKLVFLRKEKSSSTLDLLQKLFDESTDPA